ncbi:energy transducer TonB [Cysteiniphilum halobium]|uniref:energy transducer TonB n=1 Tax=Cysteiniphilum halobium TaxID=2219059 RepID=UPI000E646EFB|nr:energy transducer TonB [Cysteiniphilum halobium]
MLLRVFKIAIAITGSIAINFSIWATLNSTSKTTWHLGQTDLKVQTVESLMQALQLTETTTTASTTPVAKPLKTANVAIEKKPQEVSKAVKVHKDIVKPQTKEVKKVQEVKEIKKTKEILKQNIKKHQAVTKITQAPKLSFIPPKLNYPNTAIKNNEEGKVKIKAVIDAKGQVANVQIIQSSGFSVLDQAAIIWFKKLHFKPAQSGKTPVSATVIKIVSFNLQEQKSA